jgi:calcineurin-like phosphoesterase family protein
MNRWFTADTHFGHANIIKFTAREFETVGHMNENMIGEWNAKVRPVDLVYHLGDFGLAPLRVLGEIRKRLNGRIHLIKGNHDRDDIGKLGFEWVKDYHLLRVKDEDAQRGRSKIVLSHYAFLVWDQSHRGSWNLHGHSHGTLPDDKNARRIDVGWDVFGRPVEYEEVKAIMAKKTWKPKDHHGRR